MLFVFLEFGCGSSGAKQPAPPSDDQQPPVQTTVMPIAARDLNLPVKEGTMPLAYLVETSGSVRVVDMTTNHALAQTTAAGMSIVSIDEHRGVSIGGTVFTAGPLPADHRFAVYFDAGGLHPENEISTSIERGDPEILRKHDQTGGSPAGGTTTRPSPHP
jgi:hypothetical protein